MLGVVKYGMSRCFFSEALQLVYEHASARRSHI